jgi:arylsulfatase A
MMPSNRRDFLRTAAGITATFSARAQSRPPSAPNIIVILADDLGYGDLSCSGSSIATPNLDQMAQEGVRFTQFCAANSVCSPSRASLMTGRYPTRVGIPRVLDPADTYGLPDSETTMAQMLKSAGYATMCIGKWHLGSLPQYLPTNRGFDEYYGIPYSVDQGQRPLMHNTDIIEQPANLNSLTQRYTQWAMDFISRPRNAPFFLYLAHSFPHTPMAVSAGFSGRSSQGLYGDVVREIDSSVGQVLQSLKDNGIDSNTLVVFSSDHGPWYQGNTGGLRGRKGETFEGGIRVPFLARLPGAIPGGQLCQGLATHLDLLPTVAGLAGAPLPQNPLDGIDIWPLLSGQQTELAREAFLYFNDVYLQCARLGNWKLHVTRFNVPAFAPCPPEGRTNLPLPNPELYDLLSDPPESYDRAPGNPGVVLDIQSRIGSLLPTFPNQVTDAWSYTMSLRVAATPPGCLPARVP